MTTFTVPNVFIANTLIKSADVNANFAAIATLLNTSILPVVGTANSLVATDGSGNLEAIALTKGSLVTFGTAPVALAVGTDGQILTASSTSPDGITWASSSSSSGGELINVGLATSASSGSMTFALKQADGSTDPSSASPITIGMRSPVVTTGGYNLRTINSALSYTIPENTTLGLGTTLPGNVWVYAIDSDGAGTMKLGVSSVRYDESTLVSTTPPSATFTVTIAAPAVFTCNNHGLVNNDQIVLTSTGTLPTGLSTEVKYIVLNVTTNTFNLAISQVAGPLTTSGSQTGTHSFWIANGRIVSDAFYTSCPMRVLGKVGVSFTSYGTWIAASSVSLTPSINSGEVVAFQSTSLTDVSTATNDTITLPTVIYDTHNSFNASNGLWFAPKAGLYQVALNGFAFNSANFYILLLKNAVFSMNFGQLSAVDATLTEGTAQVMCEIGDELKLVSTGTGGILVNPIGNPYFPSWSITKIG